MDFVDVLYCAWALILSKSIDSKSLVFIDNMTQKTRLKPPQSTYLKYSANSQVKFQSSNSRGEEGDLRTYFSKVI